MVQIHFIFSHENIQNRNRCDQIHHDASGPCGSNLRGRRLTKIKSYNLQTGTEMICISIEEAFGLAEVKIGGNTALAVSLRSV